MAGNRSKAGRRRTAASTKDVTTRGRAREMLPGEAELLRTVVANSPIVLFALDRSGVFTLSEGEGLEALGLKPGEVVGRSVFDVYRDEPTVIEHNRRALAGEAFTAALEAAGRAWETSYTPLRDEDGEVVGVIGVATDVTGRKRAEAELQESGERFRNTLDGMLEGCQIIGFDWRYLYVNDAVARHGRRPKEDLLGHTMMEVYPGIDDTEMFGYLRRCMEERIPHRMENEFTYPDGAKGWFELSIQPVPEGIFVLSLDITERKRAEEISRIQRDLGIALSAATGLEETLDLGIQAAIRASGLDCGGVYLVDPSSKNLDLTCHRGLPDDFVNSVSHYDADSANARLVMAGKAVYTQHHRLDVPLEDPERREALRAMAVIPIQHQGEIVACLNVASHTLDDIPVASRDSLEAVAAQIGSVIARTTAQESLRESEERFRLLAENARDIIFRYRVAEPRGFQYVSPAAAIIAGYAPERWYEGPDFASKIVHPDDRGAFRQAMAEVRTDALELRWIHKDGDTIWTEHRLVPIYDESREVVAIEGIIRDITERKRAEEALQQAREELEGKIERQMLRRNPYGLTFRELTVLHLLTAGKADKGIAEELSISPLTAQKHVSNILTKMRAASRTEAGVRAVREGLIS